MTEPTHPPKPAPSEQERPPGRAPKVAAIPNYNFGVGLHEKHNRLFDDEGRPRVASAREIVPRSDNGLALWQRLGERIAWYTAGGDRFWPKNCRHNVLQAYLIGRMKHMWVEDLMSGILWLCLIGAEGWVLYNWWESWITINWIGNFALIATFVFLLSFVGLGLYVQLVVMSHLHRVSTKVPYDELSLTRLAPEELFYGLIIRPFANQHAFNLFFFFASIAGACIAAYYIAAEMVEYKQTNFDQLLFIFSTVLIYYFIRWLIFSLVINLAVAFAARARLFIMRAPKSYWRMVRDYLGAGLGFPIVLPLSFVTFCYIAYMWGACTFFVVALPVLFFLSNVLFGLTKVPTRVFRLTAKYNRYWWVRTRVESEDLPRLVKDIW